MTERTLRAPGVSLGSSLANTSTPKSNINTPKMSLPVVLALALLATLTPTALPAAISDSELRSVFAEGNQLFREANELSSQNPVAAEDLYRRSALRFERLVNEGGIRNGKLFHNIGSAYFRTNDIGRAILNYRKAGQYIPNDLNLQQNLNHARRTRLDSFEETQETKVLRTLLFWHYDFSTRLRSILFAIFSIVFWSAVSVRLFRSDWAPKWLPTVSGIAGALFLGSLLAETYEKVGEVTGVVVSQQSSHERVTAKATSRASGILFTRERSFGFWKTAAIGARSSCPTAASAGFHRGMQSWWNHPFHLVGVIELTGT